MARPFGGVLVTSTSAPSDRDRSDPGEGGAGESSREVRALVGDRPAGVATPVAVAFFAAFAAYALVVALVAHGAESVWGGWAAGGYACAAAVALRWWRRHPGAPLLPALAGALVVPASVLPPSWGATSEVRVVARAASLWLAHGTPYLTATQLASWRSYDPYLPGMSVFGLPHALGVPGPLGDPLVWLAAATMCALVAACHIVDPGLAPGGGRGRAWLQMLLLVACPVLALPMSLGVTDPPVIALICLGLAWAARPSGRRPDEAPGSPGAPRRGHLVERISAVRPGRPVLAGIAIGSACALKAIAWPAFPVVLALLAARDGRRPATRFAASSLGSFLGLLVVTAPALVAHPGAFWQNIVAYPLGISRRPTQAASPLPGHVLAGAGSLGHLAAIGLLLAVAVALGASLVARPPRGVAPASLRLAVCLTAMFVLAPAARFGYFAYPLAIVSWLVLSVPLRQRGWGSLLRRPLRNAAVMARRRARPPRLFTVRATLGDGDAVLTRMRGPRPLSFLGRRGPGRTWPTS